MSRKIEKPLLTEHQQLKYQRRLSSYLKDYEYKNNLQAKDVAEKIDISPQKFSYVKSDKKPYGKFINALDYMAKLGNLEEMSIGEFVEYLEGKRDKDEHDKAAGNKIYGWQRDLLQAFEPLTVKIRSEFVDLCKQSSKQGKRKMEALLAIVNILKDKDIEAIESLRETLAKLS